MGCMLIPLALLWRSPLLGSEYRRVVTRAGLCHTNQKTERTTRKALQPLPYRTRQT